MMKPLIECLHDEEVGRLLTGEIDAARTSELEQHLAICIDCRQRLEQQVGDDGWWNETESSLRSQHVAASLRDTEDGPAYAASLGETRLRESVLDLLGPTDDPNMLGRIGPYEIIGLLGQGGMGAVFKGFDRSLNRFVAIKMLLPHLAASGAARKRFAREGQAVAAVVDDHVMAIHCVDEWQGVPYLVMTYSRGVSLQKRLSDNGPLEVREILRIGMQAAKGLAAAHAQGIVHRDIKPANIFLDQNVERVQLMDFGLARAVDDASLTRSGTLAGTPQYMSPEQARAETVDHRSDLFSLGSVMYAMCTGHAPFRAESSYSVLRLITDKEPRPIREINPDVPEWLCSVINKLMAKQASDRFRSAKEIADILEECLAHVQQPAAMPLPEAVTTLPPRIIRRPPISKFVAAAAGAFALLFAGILIVLELDKGTLTIESEMDNVPIRIVQGDKVVERLTVTKSGNSVRVAAGTYVVELETKLDGMVVENDYVSLKRGETEQVKIRYSKTTVNADDAPKTLNSLDARTLDDVTAVYNEQTRQLRTELFNPPIPDLTTDQMRAAMLDAAEQYRKQGKVEVAAALENSVVASRLDDRLIFMGSLGTTPASIRQITPVFHFEIAINSLASITLSKAELRYSLKGWSSKTWGDIHPPITGKWELIAVEERGESLTQDAFNDWRQKHASWTELTIDENSLTMAGDNAAKFDFLVDYDAGILPQYTIRWDGETKFEGVLMGNGFVDDTTLVFAVDLEGSSTPKTFHTKDGKSTNLTYRRNRVTDIPADASLKTGASSESVESTAALSTEVALKIFQSHPKATDRTKNAFRTAAASAHKDGKPLNTLYLLAALIRHGSVPAIAEIAEQKKIEIKDLMERCELAAQGADVTSIEQWQMLAATANDTAKQWKHDYLGTEHLLMVLIAGGTSTQHFLSEQGIEAAAIRDMAMQIYFSPGRDAPVVRPLPEQPAPHPEMKPREPDQSINNSKPTRLQIREAIRESIATREKVAEKVSTQTRSMRANSSDDQSKTVPPLTDHARFQGAWQSLDLKTLPVKPSGLNQFSVSFLADRMAMSGPQRAGIGTFSLSPDTVPKQIECRLTFGETHVEFIGIYEFRDSQLWLCLTEGKQRPKSFGNPPAVTGLMTFALERKHVELPDVDSNASLALSDWSQSQDGAGVFATYTLSIPGIETISQGLAAGGPAVKEFSGVPGFPGKVFTLRYFLPNLSPRGMAFVAGTSFQSSLNLIELAQVAERKRLVKVFSYPDSATGVNDPIGAVPVDRPVETPEVEPMESSLKISVLKAGADQADWLKEIDATGEIIYGYEIVVR